MFIISGIKCSALAEYGLEWQWYSCSYAHHESFLKLHSRWRWLISFMGWLFYPWEKIHWYPLIWSLSSPHSRSGSFWEEKILFSYRKSKQNSPYVQPFAWSLYQLPCLLFSSFFLIRGSETTRERKRFSSVSTLFKATISLLAENLSLGSRTHPSRL